MEDVEPKQAHPPCIDCVIICGGVWHDMDFARLELLKLLAEEPAIRTRVFENYDAIDAIRDADILITYTCNVVPSLPAQEVLRDWLRAGGRWCALHGTNSILELLTDGPESGLWDAPRNAPLLMDLLGSQFISNPPIAPYQVRVADPAHPLVHGIEPFETTDELYHLETHGDLHVLLDTQCTEAGTGFVEGADAPGTHPVMYLKNWGKGAVLYHTLGHCRCHYDLQPMADWWPTVDRGAWELPIFYSLLRRSIAWLQRKAPC